MTSQNKKRRVHPVSEERVFARERFRVQLQAALHNLMGEKGVSQRELADRLGVSEARVSQMFGSAGNLTVRTVGEVLHALGCKPRVWVAERVLQMTSECEGDQQPARSTSITAALTALTQPTTMVVLGHGRWHELPRSPPQTAVPLPKLLGPSSQGWSTSPAPPVYQ